MRLPWIGPCLIAALAVVGYTAVERRPPPPVQLPVLGTVPAFSLTAHTGRPFTREALRGTVWIAEFIFTRCAGQCPLMAERTARLQQELDGAPVRFVSFSVDAAHDTPAVLAAYAERYGASAGRWDFVTGDPDAIRALAQQGFSLAVGEGGPPQEPITHSVRLVLVDRDGRIRGTYESTETDAMVRLRHDARRLTQER